MGARPGSNIDNHRCEVKWAAMSKEMAIEIRNGSLEPRGNYNGPLIFTNDLGRRHVQLGRNKDEQFLYNPIERD